jgi:hypothetical protein
MITKIFQTNAAIPNNTRMDVLFDPASDEYSKGDGRISIEKAERGGDEFLSTVFIVTFVEAVDDDEIWIG